MNKEVIVISSAVAAGALSRGITGSALKTSSNTVKLVGSLGLAVLSGYLASKVKGDDGKASAMRGAAVGVAVAQGLEAVKFAFSTPTLQKRIASSEFLSRTVGLGSPEMNGYIDAYGNYREDGMAGYIDANGNYIEDGMAGYIDENGQYVDGLGGYYDENGNYIDEMGGYYDENGQYVDGLAGYYDENGNYIEDMGAYADEQGQFAL